MANNKQAPKTPRVVEEIEVTPGVKVVRKPVWQGTGDSGWGDLIERIALAKSLGFTSFELDVTPMQIPEIKQQESRHFYVMDIFGRTIAQPTDEGEEWNAAARAKTKKGLVVTVYALVVE